MRRALTSFYILVSASYRAYAQANNLPERTLGGLDVFLPYVKDYVNTYIGKSITTEQWKSHLYAYYERNGGPEKIKALDSIDWNVSASTSDPILA